MFNYEHFKTAMKRKLNVFIRTVRRYAEAAASCTRAALSVAAIVDPSGIAAHVADLLDAPLSLMDMYNRYLPEVSSIPSTRIEFDESDWIHEGDGTCTLRIPNKWRNQHSFSVYEDQGDEEMEVVVCSGYDKRGNIVLHANTSGFKGYILRG